MKLNHYWRQLNSGTMKGLKKQTKFINCSKKNVQEVKDIYGTVNNIENKNKDMYV